MCNKLTSTVFVMQFMERSACTDTFDALTDPKAFPTHSDAMNEIWQYVKGRIKDSCVDYFAQWAYNDLQGFSKHFDDEDDCYNSCGEELFSLLDDAGTASAIDWYFDFISGEDCEAFYSIIEMDLKLDKVDFTLTEDHTDDVFSGHIESNDSGVFVSFNGYTISYPSPSGTPVIHLGVFNNDPIVHVFSDLVSINPTYSITMNCAREVNRIPEFKFYQDKVNKLLY